MFSPMNTEARPLNLSGSSVVSSSSDRPRVIILSISGFYLPSLPILKAVSKLKVLAWIQFLHHNTQIGRASCRERVF